MHTYVSSQKPSHIYRNHNMIAYARMSGIGTSLPSATVAGVVVLWPVCPCVSKDACLHLNVFS